MHRLGKLKSTPCWPCRARKAAPVVMNEAALPEVLREALRAARRCSSWCCAART